MRKSEGDGKNSFAVYEVFLSEDGSVFSWTEQPVALVAETDTHEDAKAALENELKHYASALSKPILDFANGREIEN